ncbi:MAG: hypothetical protein OEV33_00670 [Armatimonadota bacterium]|nr:hypothetical protein [Armatimonadota bacterium]
MAYVGVGRDTSYGCVLRNHYWLGEGLDLRKGELERIFPDEFGLPCSRMTPTSFIS